MNLDVMITTLKQIIQDIDLFENFIEQDDRLHADEVHQRIIKNLNYTNRFEEKSKEVNQLWVEMSEKLNHINAVMRERIKK